MKYRWLVQLVGAFLIFMCGRANAQLVKSYTELNGLPDRFIVSGIQDPNGFIWLATLNGVSRFDGYHFQNFNLNSELAIASNRVHAIATDSNRLYVGHENGMETIDYGTYAIQNIDFSAYKIDEQRFSRQVVGIKVWNSRVLFITRTGHLFELIDGQPTLLYPRNSEAGLGEPIGIEVLENQVWLLLKKEKAVLIDLRDFSAQQIYYRTDKEYKKVTSNKDGIFLFNGKGAEYATQMDTIFTPVFEQEPEVHVAYKDYKGETWLVAKDRKQIIRMNGMGKAIAVNLFTSNQNVHIRGFFEDRSKNLWIYTSDGLYKLNNLPKQFSVYGNFKDTAYHNLIPSYRGVVEGKNSLFVGSYGGLYKVTDKVIKVSEPNNTYCPYKLILHKEKLWVATEGASLMEVDTQKLSYTFYPVEKSSQFSDWNYFVSAILLNDSTLLIGSYQGILTFNMHQKRYEHVQSTSNEGGINTDVARCFLKTQDGNIWIGTLKGIKVVDQNLKLVRSYSRETHKDWFASPAVNTLRADSAGNIWIGFKQGGIAVLDSKSNTFYRFTTREGLPDDRIADMRFENNRTLWISTNVGLSRLDIRTQKVSNFYVENGLPSNEFNHGSSAKLSNNRLLFGGINGYTMINQEVKSVDEQAQSVLLSSIEYSTKDGELSKQYGVSSISEGQVVLPYFNRYLNINFALADYRIPSKNQFAYKLDGYSKDWRPLKGEHGLRFAALPYGEYTLKIKGASSTGNWSEDELAIPIRVNQVFYKTWWFLGMVFLIVGSIVYYMVQMRIQRYKEIANMRMDISSDLHDDVGSVLTRVAMQAELLGEDLPKEHATTLNSIINSCRSAMTNMRDVVWSIDSREPHADNLVDKIAEFARIQFENSPIEYELKRSTQLQRLLLSPQEKKELFFMVKEALTNILKHSNGDRALIDIRFEKQNLQLTIKDNGTQSKAEINAGSGLRNLKMRAAKINADLLIYFDNGYVVQIQLKK